MDDQIASLEGIVKSKGIKAANQIVSGYDANVVKLAFKYVRKDERKAGAQGLGGRIETLLNEVPANVREQMRSSLLAAKAKVKART